MPATEGTFVLADISAYTAYMAGTEHEHSIEILRERMRKFFGDSASRIREILAEGVPGSGATAAS